MGSDLKALANRFNQEILTQGKLDVLDEIVADDFVEHQEFPGIGPGKEGLRSFVTMVRDAFPDLKIETRGVVAEGDEVWIHTVMTGTHKGDFVGVPATGKEVTLEAIDRVRVQDGKAVEHWGVSDDLGMMTQLGVIPGTG